MPIKAPPSREALLSDIRQLRGEMAALRREKADLESLIEINAAHSDDVTEDLIEEIRSTIQENEKQFHLLSETIPIPIIVSQQADDCIIYANEAAKAFLRISPDMSRTFRSMAFYDPEVRKKLSDMLTCQGSVSHHEIRGKRADGTSFWAELSVHPQIFNDKPCLLSAFHDLTERRAAEAERLRLAAAVEQVAEGILITERNGTIRYINPAFKTITGYAKADIIGKKFRVLDQTGQTEAFYKGMWRTISSGKVWEGHIIDKKKSGEDCELKVTISPIRNAQEKVINFVAVCRDVTLEVRMEKQFRQTQKMEAIGTLAGGIAHDFNNILSGIIGYTQLAYYNIPEGQKARTQMEKVLKASYRATDLVKQILTFSRRTEKEMKAVNIVFIIKEVLKLLRASLPATIEISHELICRSGTILADPTQFHQVLMNLCTNAADAMRGKGGGILHISLTDTHLNAGDSNRYKDLSPGPYLQLSVSDTGSGIPSEIQEKIFEPFFTTKSPGHGTGMGLAMTHGIVRDHGGVITFYSEKGKGTTFQLFFPEIERKSRSKDKPLPAPLPRGNERILFVDDEAALAELGKEKLEYFGYHVTTRTDSLKTLEIFQADPERFDLVITDQTMPKMTGMQLSEEILKIRPDIPILLCSGFSDVISPETLKASGIRAFMMKPLLDSEMAKTIRRLLDKE